MCLGEGVRWLTPHLAVLFIALAGGLAAAQQTADLSPPDSRMERQIAALLPKEMDVGAVAGKAVPLKDFLERISESMTKLNGGKEVLIVIDGVAFQREDEDFNVGPILRKKVRIPASRKTLKVNAAFRLAATRFPGKGAGYFLRGNTVQLTTPKRIEEEMAEALEGTITAKFDKRPVAEALRRVVEQRATWSWPVRVVFGPEAGARARTPVTASFPAGTPLRRALKALTGMAGLDYVPVANLIYVTTPDVAGRVRAGRRSRDDLLEAINEWPLASPKLGP
jgi:hypothetical protein